jgi:hypothetical protein
MPKTGIIKRVGRKTIYYEKDIGNYFYQPVGL